MSRDRHKLATGAARQQAGRALGHASGPYRPDKQEMKMSTKTRTQTFDPSATFAVENQQERLDGLRSKVLPRLTSIKDMGISEATDTFGFEVEQSSDELVQLSLEEVQVGLRPAEGDFPALHGIRNPAFSLALSATPDGVGMTFNVGGPAEWRLFIKTLYQHRETLGEYIAEFEELYLSGDEEDDDAIEELDQLFAINVESAHFKAHGARIFFPALDYPVETEEDFDTLTNDFGALFPFYWTLLKTARGEPVNMDRLLNG